MLSLAVALCITAHATPIRDSVTIRPVVRLAVQESKGLRFHRLSTSDGLSQTRVAQIIQDDLGFMWFGTQYGLNRYDGYDFKVFAHEPGNTDSPSGTWVFSLFKDRDGYIWIGWSKGLDRLDPRTETFSRYQIDIDEESQQPNTVVHISQDRSGMLWLATGSGLHRLNPLTRSISHFRHGESADALPSNDVNWSGEDSQGRFWVGTRKGLSQFDRASGRVLRHIEVPEPVQISLFEDRLGRMWITQASSNGLALLDTATNSVTPYSFYSSDPGPTALTGVMGVGEDADGALWLGSPELGLLRLNRDRDRFQRYSYQPQDVHSIAENKVIALLKDRDGNVWTGLHSTGVNYFAKGSQRFQVFRHIPGDPNSLTLNFVNAILEDKDGALWIGNDDGLNRIDPRSGRRELIDVGLGAKPMIITLTQHPDGAIWMGTFAQGLVRYEPRTGRIERFTHDESDARSLSHNVVHHIHIDSKQTVWVATDDGLGRLDSEARTFTVHKVQSDNRFAQSYVRIAEDSHGILWLATSVAGLHRFDPTTGRFTVYRHERGDPNSLRDNTVPSVHVSRAGTLWIGTQNGLNSLDPETGAMRAYDTRHGMPANTVSCILEDEQGGIWFSTTKGLSKLTPKTKTFANYSLSDELPGNDLTGWATCSRGPQGKLYFAGFSGAVAFVPRALHAVALTGPLVLTDLEINGETARIGVGQPLERAITHSNKVTLSHAQRNFSLKFAALSYANPSAIRYRYRLDGVDEGWRESPSSVRQASYTTLPSGKYTLRVQMAADTGAWIAPGVSLSILVLPPWWATWWFRTVVALLLSLLIWWAVRARIRQVAKRIALQMQARSNERLRIAQDLHDTLLQGLLSASFQLSVVQDELDSNTKARPLIEHVSNLLRQLVEEGRHAVSGLRTWRFDTDDLERAISSIPGDLQIASTTQFRVSIEGKPRPLLPAARNEIYLIAREAISNALRHANAGLIEASLEYSSEDFRLTIRDDGVGFTADALAAKATNHFGLTVMSERASRIGGVLHVSSGAGIGSEVVVTAPGALIYQPSTRTARGAS